MFKCSVPLPVISLLLYFIAPTNPFEDRFQVVGAGSIGNKKRPEGVR